jgi:hypothetical protein
MPWTAPECGAHQDRWGRGVGADAGRVGGMFEGNDAMVIITTTGVKSTS